jgi:glucose-1-phosphate thymidylyltransferase
MIYYPLSMLMLAGIRESLVITTPESYGAFRDLLGDGRQWGVSFEFKAQDKPRGLADAFLVGREFVDGKPVCLILGDNIFFGHGLAGQLKKSARLKSGAIVFAYPVKDPERYGVVEFDAKGRAVSIEEKPSKPRSHFAVPGLYFYDGRVSEYAAGLKPSPRGEIEITDLNLEYLRRGQLKVEEMGRGVAWLDAGTHESLLQAANFVQAVEDRQGLMIACPEEIAFHQGYIDSKQLRRLAGNIPNAYGDYLVRLSHERPEGVAHDSRRHR